MLRGVSWNWDVVFGKGEAWFIIWDFSWAAICLENLNIYNWVYYLYINVYIRVRLLMIKGNNGI